MDNVCIICNSIIFNDLNDLDDLDDLDNGFVTEYCYNCNNYAVMFLDRKCTYRYFIFEKYSVYINIPKNYSCVHIMNNDLKTIDEKLKLFRHGYLGEKKYIFIINKLFYPSSQEEIENFLILI